MKIAYFDCHSGISGDMILGALIDAGVPLKELEQGLAKLKLKGFRLRSKRVRRGQIAARKLDVEVAGRQPHSRHLSEIERLIESSGLPGAVKSDALEVFRILGRAEARVHRTSIEKVHFHEVGAVDSIVDIVGGALGIHLLGPDRILASPLNTGEGTVQCDHGLLPVPAPATLELLKGIPCYSSGIQQELTTPTGAAMMRHFATEFASLPLMKIRTTGYGAGDHLIEGHPNTLRLIVGEAPEGTGEKVIQIDTNIDDMSPEWFEPVMEKLFDRGALDVFFTPIQMKKNRPAHMMSVIAYPGDLTVLSEIILTETTSFGLRVRELDRRVLEREIVKVATSYGPVPVKIGRWQGKVVQRTPEFSACAKIARKTKKPVRAVYEEAQLRASETILK